MRVIAERERIVVYLINQLYSSKKISDNSKMNYLCGQTFLGHAAP